MKKVNIIIAAAVCTALIATCAFALTPVRFTADSGINAHYTMLNRSNDSLELAVTSEIGVDKEIALHAVVATDENMTNVLDIEEITKENNITSYSFNTPARLDTVYVKPPVLYSPQSIDTITINLLADTYPSNDIFDVVGYEEIEHDGKTYIQVSVEAAGNGDILPRFPILTINGTDINGTSSLSLSEDARFTEGTFTFELPENTAEYNSLILSVGDSLVREEDSVKEVKIN